MKTFKDYVGTEKKKKIDRSNHMKWVDGDLDLKGEEDRESHFSWGPDDVEHQDVKEEYGLPHLQPHNMPIVHPDDVRDHKMSAEEEEHHWNHKNKLYDSGLHHYAHDYKFGSSGYNSPLRSSVRRGGHILLGHYKSVIAPPQPGNPWGMQSYESHKKKISAMEKVTSNATKHDMTVYRGFDPDVGLHKKPVGSFVQDHGFTGTSTRVHRALDFSDHTYLHHHDAPPHLHGVFSFARIHVPAGSLGHHLDIDPDSPHKEEHEFLLHRGTKFRVTGHSMVELDHPNAGTAWGHMIDLRVEGHHPKKLINPYAPEKS